MKKKSIVIIVENLQKFKVNNIILINQVWHWSYKILHLRIKKKIIIYKIFNYNQMKMLSTELNNQNKYNKIFKKI